jgi:hypothetical protein
LALKVDAKWLANASAISLGSVTYWLSTFELNKRVILPFKIRNVLPEMMGIVSKTIIYKL